MKLTFRDGRTVAVEKLVGTGAGQGRLRLHISSPQTHPPTVIRMDLTRAEAKIFATALSEESK